MITCSRSVITSRPLSRLAGLPPGRMATWSGPIPHYSPALALIGIRARGMWLPDEYDGTGAASAVSEIVSY